jgi:NAD(P)-dependent dehydrogenase (short-subunit alcohol dehydrogenase family)
MSHDCLPVLSYPRIYSISADRVLVLSFTMPPISTSRPTIVITGCSTGLGRALAESALEKGYNVIATARNPDSLRDLTDKGAKALKLDVTVAEAALEKFAKDAVDALYVPSIILELFSSESSVLTYAGFYSGSVDILVNNAGYLQGGAMEELS